jgi:hypothetical protein
VGKGEGVSSNSKIELENNFMKARQLWIVASSIGIGIAIMPLALNMMPQELWPLYLVWKILLFGVVPLVFLYLVSKK